MTTTGLTVYEARRSGGSEVSSIDGALMLAGLMQAGEHFGGSIRTKAKEIFQNADFKRFYRADRNRFSHGWSPEKGFLAAEWDRPGDEALLVCLLSLAQDPSDADRLRACYGYPRVTESYAGIPVVRSYFGSLFTYTFAHFWLPFECLGRDRPDAAGVSGVPAVDLSDAITLFSYLFLGTSRPDPPFPDPGLDPTPDSLELCL